MESFHLLPELILLCISHLSKPWLARTLCKELYILSNLDYIRYCLEAPITVEEYEKNLSDNKPGYYSTLYINSKKYEFKVYDLEDYPNWIVNFTNYCNQSISYNQVNMTQYNLHQKYMKCVLTDSDSLYFNISFHRSIIINRNPDISRSQIKRYFCKRLINLLNHFTKSYQLTSLYYYLFVQSNEINNCNLIQDIVSENLNHYSLEHQCHEMLEMLVSSI